MADVVIGNRVVQIGDDVPTAFAGKLLADLDFEVMMIEDVHATSPLRRYGMAPEIDSMWSDSPVFRYVSSRKSSVGLALSHARGRELVAALIATARVVLIGAGPLRVLGGLKFVESLEQLHPDLIIVVVTRYGLFGTKRDWIGTDLTSFFSGGEGDTLGAGLNQQSRPDQPPVAPVEFMTDYLSGLHVAVGALAAVCAARNGTAGQIVDVSCQDAQLALNHLVPMRLVDGELETRHTRHFSYGGVFRCADGYVEILPLEDSQWAALLRVMGDPLWADDENLSTGRARADDGVRINAEIQAWAQLHTRETLTRLGQEAGCPVAPFLEPAEVVVDQQVIVREAMVVVDADSHPRPVPRPVLADQVLGRRTESLSIPALGADTVRILGEVCGLNESSVRALVAQGVAVVAPADINRGIPTRMAPS